MRYCLIILLVMPAFAASRETTVVLADVRTGRLVRSVVVEPSMLEQRSVEPRVMTALPAGEEVAPVPVATGGGGSATLTEIIDRVALEQGVEGPLVHSVIRAESNYNPRAVSPKGALGLMQLIPATARRFGVSNAFNAQENIEGGVKYLRFLLDYYKGDYARTIAAYNAGESAVDKYHGVPPYPETMNYVYQVAKNLKAARLRQPAAPVAAAAPPVAEAAHPIQASLGADGRVYYRTP